MAPRDVASGSIGTIQTLNGSVEVRHADGTVATVNKGDPVHEGDTLLTKAGGAVGVMFNDGTSMSLGENGKLVLDKMSYDPASKTGEGHLTLQSGAFALVSGKIAKASPDALSLKTPTMTVGVRGTGLAGNANTVAMMQEKGDVTGEVFITTNSGQSLTLNGPGQAASLSASGALTPMTMSALQVMQVAGNAGAALPNAGNLLSAAFNQAAQAVQQQLQQQQQTPPPPPVPPPTGQQGPSGAEQMRAVQEAMAQEASKQVQGLKQTLVNLAKEAGEKAVATALTTFHEIVNGTAAQDAAAAERAKSDFAQVLADHASVLDHVNKALAATGDTYTATYELALAKTALDQLVTDAAKVTVDGSGHGAEALAWVTALTSANPKSSVTPVTDANSKYGDAQAFVTGLNDTNATAWSNGTLITSRGQKDSDLATDTALLPGLKAAAETAITNAHQALLNIETPLINAAAAEAAFVVQGGGLMDVLSNYFNAAKASITSIPTGWTADLAYTALTNGATIGLTADQIQLVTDLKAAISQANGVTGNPLVDIWRDAVSDIQDAYAAAKSTYDTASQALTDARQAYQDAQDASVIAAGHYADKQSDVAADAGLDGSAIGAERAGEAAWQAKLEATAAAALTSVNSALTSATAAAGRAGTDANNAAANAAANSFNFAAAQAAKLLADAEVATALSAQTSAGSAVTSALTVLHSLGIGTDGGAWSGTDANVSLGMPSNFSSALSSNQSAVTAARQSALGVYQQAVSVKAQVDQQVAVAQQEDAIAVQAMTQAQALQLQVDLQNAQTVSAAKGNAATADTSAHTSAKSAADAATAAAASRDAIKAVLDALNAAVPPSNVTGEALATYNATKAALIASVQGYYTTAAAAADAAASAGAAAGADVATADTAKANADAIDVNAVDTPTVNLAKGYSSTAASAAADASTQASTANAKASAAAAQLALAANAKAALTLAASDASAAQLRADDVAAALAAKTDVHAIINSATSATSGSLVDLKAAIQAKYDALLTKLGNANSTDLGTLYGMWNAAKAAKDAASADASATAAAQAAYNAANTAFNTIDGALSLALGYRGDLSGILSGLSTQITNAQTALGAVDTAYAAALAAQTAKTSTSTALAQAIQADQAAQKALSQVSASNDSATTKAASFDQQLQVAKDNITTALNNAAKADDLVAAADASAAQAFATAAATAASDARAHSTDSSSVVRAQTQNDLSTATSRMNDAAGKFDDVIVQVSEGLTLAGSSVLNTPAAVLTALATVKADAVAYQEALHAYATTSSAANLTTVTNALAKLNTDLSVAQAAINTANATTNAVGVAASEVFRAEQVVATAGNAYLQAIGSKNDAAAAWTLAQTYNPATQITYWKSVYDAALQTVLDAKTAAANALATGIAAQAKAAAAAADLTNYLGNVLPDLPHTAGDPAGKALTAGTLAASKALSVLGSNTDTATANTVYGQKLAADNAYTTATAIAFNFTAALNSGDVTGAAAAAQAALAQATNASNASTLVQQLTTLVSQTSNTAVAQDNTVHNLGVQWSTPKVFADSVFTQAGATVIDVLANDRRGGDNSGLSGLGDYTLTAGTASHGTVSVITVGGHQQIQYTATAGYTGKDSFSYTVSYTDAITSTTVSANTSVSLVVEGASITVPSSLSILENASATFSLAVSDGNANETVSGVVISGAPSGTILKVGSTIITATGNNFALTAGQAANGVITVIPPVDYSGQIVLTVTATAAHNLAADPGAIISVDTSKQLTLTVAPVTQGPTITVPATVSGLQNAAFDLALNVADTHLGETISAISISGFQAGSSLTVGSVTLTPSASGVITLTAAQAANATLSVHMPTNWYGDRTLLITATAQNGAAAAVTVNQAVSVHLDVTALTAQQALLVSAGSGNTRVADTAANIVAAGVANLQAHGITTFDITDTGTLAVTAVQALTLTFTRSGGGHVQVVDTAANINASGIASLAGHGITDLALSNSGTVSLGSGSGAATLTGSSGSDTYVAAATSSGTMTIIDAGGTNVLDGSAISDRGLKGARQVGNDLVIDLNGNAGGGHLVVKDQFANPGVGIDHIYTGSTNNPNVHVVGFTGGGSLSAAAATLTGTVGEDIILGNLGEATLIGGGGEDTFFVGGGNQVIYGNSTATSYGIVGGKVSFTYNSGPVTASLGNGTGSASITDGTSTWTDTLYNITELEGSAQADTLTGSSSGWSVLEGGAGNDILTGSNSASITASYKHAGAGVTVNLSGSTYSGAASGSAVEHYYVNGTLTTGTDTLVNIHGVRGSSFADVIKGGDTGFYDLVGGGGADLLVAGNAATSFRVSTTDNATVTGGAGSDSITFDDFTSGLLNNTVALAHVTGVETLRLSGGSVSQSVVFDSYSSAAGITRVDASATSGGVTFTGGSGNDAFVGGSGTADRAIFHGSAAGYRISQSNGTITVQDINTLDGNDGTDSLSGVESLVFSDRTLAVGATGTGSITVGTASQVNTFDAGDQSAPLVTRLADGGYIVSWASPDQDVSALTVVAQRYNAAGNKAGTEFVVNQVPTGDQWNGRFVQLLDGKLAAIWHDNTADGNDFGVVGRVFPADYVGGYTGSGTVSPQFLVNTTTSGFQAWPVITPTANGGFFAAWDNGGSDGARQITGQFFDSAGGKVNGEVTVGTAATDPVCGATTLSNGSVVVMWRATDEVGSDGVFARIIDSSGNMGGLIPLNSLTQGSQNSGSVVALANGGFAAIWHSDPTLTNTFDVYCRVFSPTGVPLNTPEIQVNTTTTGWQAYPAITALPDGGFLAVWDNGASGNHQVFAQRFSATGQMIGSEFPVSTPAVTNEVHPSVTTLASGDVEVTWQQPGSSSQDIFREVLHIGYGNSVLTGTAGADTLDVGGGFATIDAGDGNDTIKIGASALAQTGTVIGGLGADTFVVAAGGDTLVGGAGGDLFTFSAGSVSTQSVPTVITDFVSGSDHINLSAAGGLTYVANLPWMGSAQATAAILGSLGQNAVAFMTDGTDGWLAVHGSSLDGTLIKLTGITVAPAQSDIVGISGTYSAPVLTPENESTAVLFNGANNLHTTTNVSTAVDNITLEAWVKWDGTGTGLGFIAYNGDASFSGYGLAVYQPTGQLAFMTGGVATDLSSTAHLTAGQWQHVALVRTNGVFTVNIDGTVYNFPNGNTPVANISGNAHPGSTYIGHAGDGGTEGFQGEIADVRFWDTVRSNAEIASNLHRDITSSDPDWSALKANWTLGQGSGTVALDTSSYAHDATFSATGGMPAWVDNRVATVNGAADGRITFDSLLPVTLSIATGTLAPQHGSVTIDPVNGDWHYVPNGGFSGHDRFVVQANDGSGSLATTTISVAVTNAGVFNQTPLGGGSLFLEGAYGTTINQSVATTDPDGDPLTYTIVGGTHTAHGTATVDSATGYVQYTGDSGFYGTDTIVVRADDGFGGTVDRTVKLHLNDAPNLFTVGTQTASYTFESLSAGNIGGQDGWVVNSGPGFNPGLATVGTSGIGVLGDYNFGSKALVPGSAPAVGMEISHLSNGGFVMPSVSPMATVSLQYDFVPNYWGSTMSFGTDVNGDGNLFGAGEANSGAGLIMTTGTAGIGQASLRDATGAIFTANVTLHGPSDGYAEWISYRVDYDLNAFNGCGSMSLWMRENIPGYDTWVSIPGLQNLPLNANWLSSGSSNPALWNGIAFAAGNGEALLDNISVSVNSMPALKAIQEDVSAAANSGTLVSDLVAGHTTDSSVAAGGMGIAVTGIPMNVNGSWQYSLDNGAHWVDMGNALTQSSALVLAATAKVRFQPTTPNFNGDVNFDFKAWDGTDGATSGSLVDTYAGSSVARAYSNSSVTASLRVLPVEDPPVWQGLMIGTAAQTSFSVANGGSVSGNLLATDPDGEMLTFTLSGGSKTAHGTVMLTGSNLNYMADSGYAGSDTFTINVSDGHGNVVAQSFTANMGYDGHMLNLVPPSLVMGQSGTFTLSEAYLNPTDSIKVGDSHLVYTVGTLAHQGTLMKGTTVLGSGATFTQADVTADLIKYVAAGTVGSTSIDLNLSDGIGGTTSTNVMFMVAAANNAPTLTVGTSVFAAQGTPVSIMSGTFGLNASDPDGGPASQLSYIVTDLPDHGALVLNGRVLAVGDAFNAADITGGGTMGLNYYNDGSASTTDSFQVRLTDGQNLLTPQTVSIAVQPINQAPVAGAGAGYALCVSGGGAGAVTVSDASGKLAFADAVTLEAWVKPQASEVSGQLHAVVARGSMNGSVEYGLFVKEVTPGVFTLTAVVGGTEVTLSNPATFTGAWHHVAASISSSGTVTLYLDGAIYGTASIPATPLPVTDTASLGLGIPVGKTGSALNGLLDEVRVWHGVRTQAEIAASMSTELHGYETGLSGYWRFDGLSINPTDSSVNALMSTGSTASYTFSDRLAPTYTVSNDGALSGSLTGSDPEGHALTYALYNSGTTTGQPSHGALTLNANGSFVYTPDFGFYGTDTIRYTVSDGTITSMPAVAKLVVQSPGDHAPVLGGLSVNNSAAYFNGNTGYAAGQALAMSTGNFTLEAWINTSDTSMGTRIIVGQGNNTGGAAGTFALALVDGKLTFLSPDTYAGAQWNLQSNTTYNDGAWHHVAVVRTDGVYKLYADDQVIDTVVVTTPTAQPSATDLMVGGMHNGGVTSVDTATAFRGLIDDVRVWDVARTGAQIVTGKGLQPTGAETGLVGAWTFDNVGGTEPVASLNPTGPALVPIGTSMPSVSDNEALHFDGSTSAALTIDNSIAQGSGPLTFEAWIKTSSYTNQTIAFIGQDGVNTGMSLYVAANGRLGIGQSQNGAVPTGSMIVADGQWHHVAGVVTSAGAVTYYVDGVLDGTATINAYNLNGPVYLGSSAAAGTPAQNFMGDISDVRIWGVARDQAAIQTDMEPAGAGAQSGLLGAWTAHDGAIVTLTGPTVTASGDVTASTNAPVGGDHIATYAGHAVSGTVEVYDQDGGSLTLGTQTGGAPTHGTLTLGSNGAFTYTPTAGYVGTDTFTLRLSDGTLASTKTYTVDVENPVTVAGAAERSAVLFANGTSQAATINLPGDVFSGNQISVEFDVNLSDTNLVQTLFSLGSGANPMLKATVDAAGHLGLYVDSDPNMGGWSSFPGVSTITSSAWHHVAVSYDHGTARIYLDGSLSATVTDTTGGTSGLSSLNTMTIASELNSSNFAKGMFDNVKVWNTTLSASQIEDGPHLGSGTGDNLVGNWTFDSHHGDGAGNDTNYDAYMNLGGGHVGTPPMRAAHFDAGHNVDLGNASALAVTGGDAFTYGAWVKTSSTALSTLFSIGDNVSGNGIILYITPDGTLQLDGAQQGGAAASIEVVNDGMWHHVAVSYNGAGTATYYVDGVAAGASSGYINLHTSGNVSSLGIRADGGEPFIGDMGDATIWSRALGASDIKEMMVHGLGGHEYGLTGYWSLDEGTGTIAYSQTGAVNGTYDAGTTWTSSNHADLVASVQQAQAFTFDGSKYLSAGDILDPGANDFTLEAWVKPTTLTGDQMIIAKDAPGSTQPVMSLFLHNGVPTLHLTGADGVGYVLQAGSVTVNQWSHIAVTRGGDQYTLYVDGVAVKSVSALDADISNSYNLTIGARSDLAGTGYDATTTFHGQIADVRVWSVERSADDIFNETVSSDASDEGLRASWVGTGLTDLSGNGHTLTLPSGVTNVVQSTSDLPVYSDGLGVPRDGQYHGALIAHDATGATISYSTGTAPTHGTLVLNADGSFVYKPNSGYEGLDSFTLTATANGVSSSQTVALRVEDPTEIVGATQHMGQLLLDGSNHAVVANAGQIAWLGGNDFTMEAWIDPTAAAIAANEAVILSKQFGQGPGTVQLRLLLDHGQLAFMASDGTDDGLWTGTAYVLKSPTALTAGDWAHVAVSRSGDVFTLYVNGEAVSSIINPFTSSLSSNADLWVGQSLAGGVGANGFDGAISDVRLWGYGRSASDIGSSYNQVLDGSESGLIGYWNGLGGLQDLSGNGHQLVLPSDNPPVMAMVPETATHFGGGSHISIGTGVGQGSGPLTYEAWVRTSYGSAAQTIFSTDSVTTGQGLSIYVGADGKIHVDAVNSAGSTTSSSVLNDGLWHHVAVTMATGGAYTIYVDGTPEVTGTVGAFNLSGPLNIGSDAAGALGFHGEIAEARIWNATLSGLQVSHAMNNEQTGAEAGLAGYWRLDEAPVGNVVQDSTVGNHDGTVVGNLLAISHNDAPIYDDVLSAMAGSPYHGTLDAIAPTSAGGNVTWALGTAPTHGSLVVNTDGTFTYTPVSGWYGIDSFNVVATGSDGNTTTKMLSVRTESPVEFMGSGAAGGSLQFGGDHYAVANTVNLTNKSFSWEFWANKATQTTATAQTLLSEGSGGVGQNLFVGFDASGHLRFSLDGSSGGAAATYNAAADAGAWHHWAGTYDATTNTLTLYRDGVAVQSVVTSSDYTNTDMNLYVGGTPATGGSYVGQLDQVRLFDDVRTPTEIWNNWHRTESVSTDHLIAEWSMDRISSMSNSTTGMVLDSSGHNANLVLATTIADMVGNHGLVMGMGTSLSTFNGHAALAVGSQGLVAANASTLVTGTGAFTYGAWVRTNGSGRQDILGIGDVNTPQGAAEFYIENGQVVLSGPFVTAMASTATVNDGNWHYVAASYNGAGQVSIYIDNAAPEIYAASDNFNILMSSPLSGATVGGLVSAPASNVFGGQLSEVAVWNIALDGTQLQGVASQGAAAVSASNLLADWTMSAAEKAVYVNTSGKVSDFNGTSSHVHVADTSKLDFSHDFTVETWIRPDTVSADQSILSATSLLGASTVDLFNLEIANGQLVFFMVGDGGSNTPSAGLTLLGPAIGIGVWSHVAVTVHNDVATLYVNGQAIASSSAFVGSRIGSISSFDIGSYGNGSGAFYDGLMSDVRVWNTARSANDINSYQGFRLSGQEDHLAGNWRLETTAAGTTPDSTGHGAGTATSIALTGAKAALFDDVVTTREDTELRAGLFDVDHANLTQPTWATIAQGPQHGTLSLVGTTVLGTTTLSAGAVFLTGGSLSAGASGYSYTPNANYFGSDYFVVAINDGTGNLTYGTVAIGVRSVRDEPTLSGLSNFSVAENGTHALTIQVADDVGAIGGDQFTVDMVAGHGGISLRTIGGLSFVSGTVNGSSHLIFTGTLDRINAALSGATYAAAPLWTGSDAITFNVWDSTNGTSLVSSGTMNITTSGSGNLAPETFMGDIGHSVAGAVYNGLLLGSDPEGGTLTFAKTSNPLHGGTVTVDTGGTYHYTGAAGYTGWDSFGYSVSDGSNTTAGTAQVAVYDHSRTWQGGATGTWSTAASWSSGTLPDSGALVQMSNAVVDHWFGNDAVGGLLLTGSAINVFGGTIALGVAGDLDAASRLGIASSGVLSLADHAVLTDFGSFNLSAGGALAGSGTLVANGATTLSGTVGLGANTVVLNNGATLSGASLSGTGSVRLNNGSMSVAAAMNWIGAAFENAAATLLFIDANGGNAGLTLDHAFDNKGQIQMSGGSDYFSSQLVVHDALSNHGTIVAGGFNLYSDTIAATSFDNYGVVDVGHTLNLTVGTFDNHATLSLSGGNSLTVGDSGAMTHAHFDNYGKIAGNGGINLVDADFVNHGYINPGDSSSASSLTVMGSLTMGSDSHLVLDYWNGTFDRLAVNGALTLDGTLDLYTHGTINTQMSSTLLTWTNQAGSFDVIHGIDSGTGWIWDPTVSGNSLSVTSHSASYVNNNGYYNGSSIADYVIGYGSNEVVHLNGGADVYTGHGSYNTVGVSDLAFHFLDGGSGGGNTLQWENVNGQSFDLSALWNNALQNFDVLDLSHASNNNAVLDMAHLHSMLNGTNAVTGTTNALVVIGGSNVTLADSGWQATGATELTVNGHHDSYTQYSNGDTHVYVENHTHVG